MIEFSLFFKAFRLGKHYIRCTSLLFWWVFFATVPVFSQSKTALPPAMVFVPGGSLMLGCTPEQQSCMSDECSAREVTVGDFYMAVFEVTQAQWKLAMNESNPSILQLCGDTCPVEQISWYQAAVFCNRLSDMYGYEKCYYQDDQFKTPHLNYVDGQTNTSPNIFWKKDANGFRFPTEVEWEYAARGGTTAPQQTRYSGSNNAAAVAWYCENSNVSYAAPPIAGCIAGRIGTKPVGTLASNALGIYDMSGNVWEFCFDLYDQSCAAFQSDCAPPATVPQTRNRVIRGGGFASQTTFIRTANRSDTGTGVPPEAYLQKIIGVRLVRNP